MTEATKQGETERCLACGHVDPHTRSEYEDTHSRCEHTTKKRHAGIDCGHKRYREDCASLDTGSCWIETIYCECTEDDMTISALRAALQEAEEERDAAREGSEFAVEESRIYFARAESAESRAQKAMALLKRVEWVGDDGTGESYCMFCNGSYPEHDAGCGLSEVLREGASNGA